jgi:SAM-dependent methyltransferase
MESGNTPYSNEIARVRDVYDSFETEGRYEAMWSPFDEFEAAHRSQQALSMAKLLSNAGLQSLNGLRVLDVGCGRGRQLRMFLDMGARPDDLDGVDVHEPSLDIARSLAPHLRFSTYSGSALPFPDSSFDLVTQFVVFSSIAPSELRSRLAREMVRVLRPGGHVFWWDMPHLAANAGGTDKPLQVGELFGTLGRSEISVGSRPKLGHCMRMPHGVRGFLAPLLDRLPLVNYPATHVAALVGPKT